MASTMASTLALSRPSEKFGTHSTSVDITHEDSWSTREPQLASAVCSFSVHVLSARLHLEPATSRRTNPSRKALTQEALADESSISVAKYAIGTGLGWGRDSRRRNCQRLPGNFKR